MFTNLGKFAAIGFIGTLVLAGCSSDDSPTNHAPTAKITGELNVKVNKDVALDGTGSTDPDKQTLKFAWKVTDPAGAAIDLKEAAKADKITFKPAAVGDYPVELTVSDGSLTNTQKVTVKAAAEGQNSPPNAKATADVTTQLAGKLVKLDGSTSTDPDSDALTYKWTVKTKPTGSTGATFTPDDKTDKVSFKPDVKGDYVVSLVVNDKKVDSAAFDLSIKAVDILAKAKKNADTVAKDTDLKLDGEGSGAANGQAVTYQWTVTDKVAASNPTLSTPTAKETNFKADKPGDYKVNLVVSQGGANSDPYVVTITVQ